MKLIYGISRWTNPSRAAARHIDNGQREPLCGGRGRKIFSWQEEEGEPTCASCIRIMNKQKQCSVVAPVSGSADNCEHDYNDGVVTGLLMCLKCGAIK